MAWLPITAPLLAGALLLVLSTYVCLRRPPQPLWPDLLIFHAFPLSFVLGDAITFHAASMTVKDIGLGLLYTGVVGGSSWWFRVALAHLSFRRSGLRWLEPARRLTAVWAAVAITFAVTNPLHRLLLVPHLDARNEYQPAWWFVSSVGWLLMFGSASVFLYLLVRELRSPVDPRERLNSALLLAASLLPTAANFAWIAWSDLPFDPSAAGLAIAALLLTIGVSRNRIFEVVPISFRSVVDFDPDAILICTPSHRVGHLNPAARVLFAEVAPALEPVGQRLDVVCDQAFGGGSGWQPAPVQNIVGRSNSSPVLVRDRLGRTLRFEAFEVDTKAKRGSVLAVRLHDVSAEMALRNSRRSAAVRTAERLRGLLLPVVEGAERASALVTGTTAIDRSVGDQVRRLRAAAHRAHEEIEQLSNEVLTESGSFKGPRTRD